MLLSKISDGNCRAVMLFVSPDSVESPFVRAESHRAFSVKKPIYGVYLENNVDVDPTMLAYIAQIQSTFIKSHSNMSSALEEVLSASKLLMEGKQSAIVGVSSGMQSIEKLWNEAEVLINHRGPDGKLSKLGEAEALYRQITEKDASDNRGWLGMLKCRCLTEPESPEHAAKLLSEANNYYCYIMNSDEDDSIGRICTQYNDILWNNTFDMFEAAVSDRKKRADEICEYAKKFPNSSLLTSVSPAVTTRYAEVSEKVREAEKNNMKKCKAKMAGRKIGAVVSLVVMLASGLPAFIFGSASISEVLGEYGFGSDKVPYGMMIYAIVIGIAAVVLGVWSVKTQFAYSKTAEKSKKYTFACIAVVIVIVLILMFSIESGNMEYIIYQREKIV